MIATPIYGLPIDDSARALTCVTITGADDAVDPQALLDLAAEFPFVEWGILSSASREGLPRYPTCAWIRRLLDLDLRSDRATRMSLHLCGGRARAMRDGDFAQAIDGLPSYLPFGRVQINGFDARQDNPEVLERALDWLPAGREAILQVRSAEDLAPAAEMARRIARCRCSILFDASGGEGRKADAYPEPPPRVRMGYAGGLGPGNVDSELPAMIAARQRTIDAGHVVAPFWIDMESGVRRDDRFDLGLVREVLLRTRGAIVDVQ